MDIQGVIRNRDVPSLAFMIGMALSVRHAACNICKEVAGEEEKERMKSIILGLGF